MTKRTLKPRMTAHRRAVSGPVVRRLFEQLQKGWEEMDHVSRGDHLGDLVKRGCTNRGLAKDLNQSEATIRRYTILASLPEADRKALKNGESAKEALKRKAFLDRVRKNRERFEEEIRSGGPSDEIADVILDFCRAKDGVPDSPTDDVYLLCLLDMVKRYSRGDVDARPIPSTGRKKLRLVELFRTTEPPKSTDDFEFERKAEWLANILLGIEPEYVIRENAMGKAENRRGELEDKLTPQQREQRAWDRYRFLEAGPSHWPKN